MERRLLSAAEINEGLKTLADWSVKGKSLTKRFEFDNFAASLGFVNLVGVVADEMDHHPDIKLGWGYAEFAISTHDRGGVTDVDLTLARRINEI